MTERCRTTVTWADTGITNRCTRPDGHDGPHSDGLWHFDNYGLRYPTDEPRPDDVLDGAR